MIYGRQNPARKQDTTPDDLINRLREAIETARRLRKERVYTGTILYWAKLVAEANRAVHVSAEPQDQIVLKMAAELESIVVARRLTTGRPAKPSTQSGPVAAGQAGTAVRK